MGCIVIINLDLYDVKLFIAFRFLYASQMSLYDAFCFIFCHWNIVNKLHKPHKEYIVFVDAVINWS